MTTLLLVPLEDAVVFPNMSLTLPIDVGDEERVLIVPRHENEFGTVGTVAEVVDRVRLPGGARAVTINGLHRGVAGAAHTDAAGEPDGDRSASACFHPRCRRTTSAGHRTVSRAGARHPRGGDRPRETGRGR